MSINKTNLIAGIVLTSAITLPLADVSQVEAATQVKYVNSKTGLNVRSGPSTSHQKLGRLAYKEKVTVLSMTNGWAKINYSGTTAYVYSIYLQSAAPSGTTQGTIKYVNSTTGLNVRSGPSTSHQKLGRLAYKEKVTVLSMTNGWAKINYNGTTQGTIKYVNSTTGLNVRSGPSTSHQKLGRLAYKEKVTVLSTSNGWSKINYNGTTAYVYNIYLQSTVPSGTTQGTIKYVNSTTGLNVRSGPSTSHQKLGRLAYKEKVTVLSTSNGWSKINYNGTTAYVSDSYLQNTIPSGNTSVSTNAADVIAYAKKFLGVPYVWGGTQPSGFDCSGFTQYVFKHKAGITLPRNSYVQTLYGKSVSKENLQPGDLVFFDTKGVNDGNVSHVGIYIGNGQMIHASFSQQKIVIDNFYNSYFQRTYVNARRVL